MMGETGLFDRPMGNTKLPVTLAHEYNMPVGKPHEPSREIHLPFDGDIRFYPYVVSCERPEIVLLPQGPIRPRGRNLKGIRPLDGVLCVEKPADRLAYARAVFHRDPLPPVDIVANQESAPPAIDLDLDKR